MSGPGGSLDPRKSDTDACNDLLCRNIKFINTQSLLIYIYFIDFFSFPLKTM